MWIFPSHVSINETRRVWAYHHLLEQFLTAIPCHHFVKYFPRYPSEIVYEAIDLLMRTRTFSLFTLLSIGIYFSTVSTAWSRQEALFNHSNILSIVWCLLPGDDQTVDKLKSLESWLCGKNLQNIVYVQRHFIKTCKQWQHGFIQAWKRFYQILREVDLH